MIWREKVEEQEQENTQTLWLAVCRKRINNRSEGTEKAEAAIWPSKINVNNSPLMCTKVLIRATSKFDTRNLIAKSREWDAGARGREGGREGGGGNRTCRGRRKKRQFFFFWQVLLKRRKNLRMRIDYTKVEQVLTFSSGQKKFSTLFFYPTPAPFPFLNEARRLKEKLNFFPGEKLLVLGASEVPIRVG